MFINKISKQKALQLAKTKWWTKTAPYEVVKFQLFTDKLCMPFELYHEMLQSCLHRPVFTHEFMDMNSLHKEFLGTKAAPTLDEILNLIPKEKQIVIKLL